MKIYVVFGSKSDENIYKSLCDCLESQGHQVTFEVLSAHRNPDELAQSLQSLEYDCVVAGAGLAAHLPGVVASKTLKPVIGIPVRSQMGGMDALLSIVQMPRGVPVLTYAHNDYSILGKILTDLEKSKTNIINLKGSDISFEWVAKKMSILRSCAEDTGLDLKINGESDQGVEIQLADLENENSFVQGIVVPTMNPDKLQKKEAVRYVEKMLEIPALFVGVNNIVNGFISSLKFIDNENFNKQRTEVLKKLKKGSWT